MDALTSSGKGGMSMVKGRDDGGTRVFTWVSLLNGKGLGVRGIKDEVSGNIGPLLSL